MVHPPGIIPAGSPVGAGAPYIGKLAESFASEQGATQLMNKLLQKEYTNGSTQPAQPILSATDSNISSIEYNALF